MLIFILGIFCAAGLFITFKFWDKYDVDPFFATVINYLTSAVVSYFICAEKPTVASTVSVEWLPFAIGLGCISLIDFNLNSYVTKKLGIGVTSISSKLSLLIPVTLAIVLFSETVTAIKVLGIVAAIVALIMISIRKGEGISGSVQWKKIYYFLPLFVFVGSGVNDFLMLSLGRVNSGANASDVTNVVFVVFTMAFLVGIATFIMSMLAGKMSVKGFLKRRNVIGGVVMGLVSVCCFSLYLFGVGQLTERGWDGSILASIYAIGVLTISVLCGIVGFKERFSLLNYIGIVVALASIAILSATA